MPILKITLLATLTFLVSSCQKCERTQNTSTETEETQSTATPKIDDSLKNLVIEDIFEGSEEPAKKGDRISVHYVGTFADSGEQFDSSVKRKKPFDFQLGVGKVIKGWDAGIVGMKVGGKRKLSIPPELAYGTKGIPGAIPANATLNFEVELLKIYPEK